MKDGDVEFVQVVTSMVVCTTGVAAILHVDARRLARRRRLDDPWPPSTLDAAILGTFLFSWAYGAPALIIHFVRSRWSLVGVGLGLLWAVLLVATDVAAQVAASAVIDALGL